MIVKNREKNKRKESMLMRIDRHIQSKTFSNLVPVYLRPHPSPSSSFCTPPPANPCPTGAPMHVYLFSPSITCPTRYSGWNDTIRGGDAYMYPPPCGGGGGIILVWYTGLNGIGTSPPCGTGCPLHIIINQFYLGLLKKTNL